MKTIRYLLIALAVFCLLPLWSAQAGAEVTHDRGQIPVDETLYNECTGEYVHLTGIMMWNGHTVLTSPGVYHWGYQMKYQGVTGVGETSGIRYRGIGGEHGYGSDVENDQLPYHYAAGMIYTLHLVAQGNAPDLRVTNRVHVTVTPDFRYVVEIYDYELVCK